MGNKQTAVEWLVKELNLEGYDYTVKQAKEMEQQQIVEAFHEGMQTNFDPNYGISLNYYESTYGK